MPATCMAPAGDGSICGRPVVIIDPERGVLVCEEHRPAVRGDVAALQMRFWGHVVPVVARVVEEWEGRDTDST